MIDISDKIMDQLKCLCYNLGVEVFGYVTDKNDFVIERLTDLDYSTSLAFYNVERKFHTHPIIKPNNKNIFGVFCFPSPPDINNTNYVHISLVVTPLGIWQITNTDVNRTNYKLLEMDVWNYAIQSSMIVSTEIKWNTDIFIKCMNHLDLGLNFEFRPFTLSENEKVLITNNLLNLLNIYGIAIGNSTVFIAWYNPDTLPIVDKQQINPRVTNDFLIKDRRRLRNVYKGEPLNVKSPTQHNSPIMSLHFLDEAKSLEKWLDEGRKYSTFNLILSKVLTSTIPNENRHILNPVRDYDNELSGATVALANYIRDHKLETVIKQKLHEIEQENN